MLVRGMLAAAGLAAATGLAPAAGLAPGPGGPALAAASGRAAGQPGPGLTITSVTAGRSAGGRLFILVRLRDTGHGPVSADGRARLTGGPGGTQSRPVRATRRVTLAPGQRAAMTFLLGAGLPAGPWHARIRVVSGQAWTTARATIQFPARSGPGPLRFLKPVAA